MTILSWNLVRNLPVKPLEFAANHENFAWRKHAASRFGILKSDPQKFASNSLTRAFQSDKDSISLLLSNRNRVIQAHPEYGQAKFIAIWYDGEPWAILCNQHGAIVIDSSLVSTIPRQTENASERYEYLLEIWERSGNSDRLPLDQISSYIG